MKRFSKAHLESLRGKRPDAYLDALLSIPSVNGFVEVADESYTNLARKHGCLAAKRRLLVKSSARRLGSKIDPDILAADLPGLQAMILSQPDYTKRIEGIALFEQQESLIASAECTPCQRNKAAATVRVWLQKQRNSTIQG